MSWVNDKRKQITDSVINVVKGIHDAALDIGRFLVTLDFQYLESGIKTFFKEVMAPVFKPVFKILGIEDEDIYATAVVTTPLITSEAKYIKTNILQAIRDDLDIAEQLRYAMATSQRITVRRYYNYGRDNYIHGVPTTEVSEYFTDANSATAIIETEEGEPITVTYSHLGEVSPDLWCKDYLLDNTSYTIETDTLLVGSSIWSYKDCVLNGAEDAYIINITRDIQTLVVVEDHVIIGTVATVETTTAFTRTTTTIDNGTPAELSVVVVDTTPVVTTQTGDGSNDGTTITPVSSTDTTSTEDSTLGGEVTLPNEGDYYALMYFLDSIPNVLKIWFYEVASNVYPDLVIPVLGGDIDNLETLPIVPIRRQFTNVNNDKESEEYKSSKAILDLLGVISLDDITEAISENGDINSIQDAYIIFGTNLYNEDPHNRIYLFNFFSMLGRATNVTKADFDAMNASSKSANVFTYTVSEDRYNSALSCNYIEEVSIVGTIGNVGYVKVAFEILANTESEIAEGEVGEVGDDVENKSSGLINSVFTISAQLTETTYNRIEVSGLIATTYILAEGSRVDIKVIEMVDPNSNSAADKSTRANFLIPTSNYILNALTPMEVEQVIYDAIHLVIYAEQVQHLEYYQTPAFLSFVSFAIQITAIIVLIFSVGTASNLSAALWALAEMLLIQIGLTFLLKEILTHNLSDLEKAAVLLLYVAASYGANAAAATEQLALTFADTLLLIVSAVSVFIQIDTSGKVEELQQEQKEFSSLLTSKQEELDAANSFLNPDGSMDTFDLLNSSVVPVLDTWSTPDEFYERSLLVNVAPIVLDGASSFLDSALDLDTIRPNF